MTGTQHIQAIVFDFDGLILDTETAWYEAFAEIYRERGAHLPIELWAQIVGTQDDRPFDPCDYLAECTGQPAPRQETWELGRQKHIVLMQGKTTRPGVLDYLAAAKELGLKIGLASSSDREWVLSHLEQHNLLHHFEVIRTRDDVRKTKPDPELYLQALEALGVEPSRAIAFEDSPNGVQAAKRAGMYGVIVPNELTGRFTFGEHDLRLNSMADMPLAQVIHRLTSFDSL
ncbi:MAG TPA: HAD family hydrolase [Bacilli bacterium]|nr:HAD family hydrolase [Bacilli bacterium]